MEAGVLSKIVLVKNPSNLPKDISHDVAITKLARKYELVLLFCFGDEKYKLPTSYLVPHNVRIINYDYETLQNSLKDVQSCLRGFGVGVVSRHHSDEDPLPMLLTGSILSVPKGTELTVLSPTIPLELEEEPEEDSTGTWDLF